MLCQTASDAVASPYVGRWAGRTLLPGVFDWLRAQFASRGYSPTSPGPGRAYLASGQDELRRRW